MQRQPAVKNAAAAGSGPEFAVRVRAGGSLRRAQCARCARGARCQTNQLLAPGFSLVTSGASLNRAAATSMGRGGCRCVNVCRPSQPSQCRRGIVLSGFATAQGELTRVQGCHSASIAHRTAHARAGLALFQEHFLQFHRYVLHGHHTSDGDAHSRRRLGAQIACAISA
jgi:hypothetical protein